MAFGASAGVNNEVNENLNLSWGVGNFVKEAWEKGVPNAEFREPTKEEQAGMLRLPVHKVLRSGKSAEEAVAKVLEQAQVAKIEEGTKAVAETKPVVETKPDTPSPAKVEPQPDLLSTDAMKSIIKKSKTANEAITEITFNSNLNIFSLKPAFSVLFLPLQNSPVQNK